MGTVPVLKEESPDFTGSAVLNRGVGLQLQPGQNKTNNNNNNNNKSPKIGIRVVEPFLLLTKKTAL